MHTATLISAAINRNGVLTRIALTQAHLGNVKGAIATVTHIDAPLRRNAPLIVRVFTITVVRQRFFRNRTTRLQIRCRVVTMVSSYRRLNGVRIVCPPISLRCRNRLPPGPPSSLSAIIYSDQAYREDQD